MLTLFLGLAVVGLLVCLAALAALLVAAWHYEVESARARQ